MANFSWYDIELEKEQDVELYELCDNWVEKRTRYWTIWTIWSWFAQEKTVFLYIHRKKEKGNIIGQQ